MNAIINLHPTCNHSGMSYLIENLNIKYCAYMYCDERDKSIDLGIDTEGIFIYQNLAKTFSSLEECVPLDKQLLESLKPYESNAFEIIYRWRNSLGLKGTYMEMKDFYYKAVRYWNDFIIKKNIDFLYICDTPHSIIEYTIYSICKIRNIPIVLTQFMPFIKGEYAPSYFAVGIAELHGNFSSDYRKKIDQCIELEEKDIILPDYYEAYFNSYINKDSVNKQLIVSLPQVGILTLVFQRAKLYYNQKRYKVLFIKMKSFFANIIGTKKLLKFVNKLEVCPDKNEKFVFFPLHLQPEASTVPTTGIYSDMRLVATIVSKSLPKGITLYIKEHPAFWSAKDSQDNMKDVRSKEFYRELLALPNVRIIKHSANTMDLVKKSEMVVTVNGTVGFESLINEVPMIMFGNAYYKYIRGVNKVSNVEECSETVEKILSKTILPIERKEIKIFLSVLSDITVPATSDPKGCKNSGCKTLGYEENHLCLAKGIVDYVKRVYPSIIS